MRFLRLSIFISLTLSVLANFYSSFISTLKGGVIDAQRFLDGAQAWAKSGTFEFALNTQYFVQFLGFFIRHFSFDRFLLSLIGIILFYVTLYISFNKIFHLYSSLQSTRFLSSGKFSRDSSFFSFIALPARHYYVLIFSILYISLLSPSFILRIGNLAREPYISGGLIASTAVLIYLHAYKTLNLKIGFLAFFLLAISLFFVPFHKGSIFFFIIVWLLFSLILLSGANFKFHASNLLKFRPNIKKTVLFNLFAISFFYLAVSLSAPMLFGRMDESNATKLIASAFTADTDKLNEVAGTKASKSADAQYDLGFDFSSPAGILGTSVRANIYYYLYPFEPKNLSEIYIFSENIIRLYVIYSLLRLSFFSRSIAFGAKRAVLILLVLYLSCNSIFALGTANFGTGSRHHATLSPVFLLVIPLLKKTKKLTYSS